MNDNQRETLLSSAFHTKETHVGAHLMRPISLASYDVLLRTGNPIMSGEMPNDGTPEFTSAILGFVYAHCGPWPEVVRASFDEQEYRESALIFCGDLTPGDFKDALNALEQQGRQIEVAQIEAVGTGAKKQRRATSRVS